VNPYRVVATLRSNESAVPNPEGVRSELELALREQYSKALEAGTLTIEVELEVFENLYG